MGKRINQLTPAQTNLLTNDRVVIDRLNQGGTFTTYYISGQELINAALAQVPTPKYVSGTGTNSIKSNISGVLASGHYSYASGQNVEASGDHSFIHSKNSTVSGNRSAVIGGENIDVIADDTVGTPNLLIANNYLAKYNAQPDIQVGYDNLTVITKGILDTTVADYLPLVGGTLTGDLTVNTNVSIGGNLEVLGTMTTIDTETLQAKDNNIELNYGGTHTSANGGGITIIDGVSVGVHSEWKIDANGNWNTPQSVGIGISIPTEKVHIVGNTLSDGNIIISDKRFINAQNGGGQLNLRAFEDDGGVFLSTDAGGYAESGVWLNPASGFNMPSEIFDYTRGLKIYTSAIIDDFGFGLEINRVKTVPDVRLGLLSDKPSISIGETTSSNYTSGIGDSLPTIINSKSSTVNAGVVNGAILGGENITLSTNDTVATANLRIANNYLAKYNAQPDIQVGYDNLTIITKGILDTTVADYLPLVGGTITGDLIVDGNFGVGISPTEKLHVNGIIKSDTHKVGTTTNTSDASVGFDSRIYKNVRWSADFTDTRGLNIFYLTNGMSITVYIENLNATARTINIVASETNSGTVAVECSDGTGDSATSTLVNGSGGKRTIRVANIDGVFIGTIN